MGTNIKNNVTWVGKFDWELESFHGSDHSIKNGSSQNTYPILGEKTVLIDTARAFLSAGFPINRKKEPKLSSIGSIVANHGNVNHSNSFPMIFAISPWLVPPKQSCHVPVGTIGMWGGAVSENPDIYWISGTTRSWLNDLCSIIGDE